MCIDIYVSILAVYYYTVYSIIMINNWLSKKLVLNKIHDIEFCYIKYKYSIRFWFFFTSQLIVFNILLHSNIHYFIYLL